MGQRQTSQSQSSHLSPADVCLGLCQEINVLLHAKLQSRSIRHTLPGRGAFSAMLHVCCAVRVKLTAVSEALNSHHLVYQDHAAEAQHIFAAVLSDHFFKPGRPDSKPLSLPGLSAPSVRCSRKRPMLEEEQEGVSGETIVLCGVWQRNIRHALVADMTSDRAFLLTSQSPSSSYERLYSNPAV